MQMVGSCSCEGWKGSKALADEAASSLLGGTSATQRKMAGKMDRYQCSACHHPLIGTCSSSSFSMSISSFSFHLLLHVRVLVWGHTTAPKSPAVTGRSKPPIFPLGVLCLFSFPRLLPPFSCHLHRSRSLPLHPSRHATHSGLCTGRGSFICCLLATHKSTALLTGTSSRRARIDFDLPLYVEPLKAEKTHPTSGLVRCVRCVRAMCAMCDVVWYVCDDVWACTKHRTRRVDAIGRGRTRTTSQRGAAHPQIDRVPRAKASHHRPARVLTTTLTVSPSLLRCSSSPIFFFIHPPGNCSCHPPMKPMLQPRAKPTRPAQRWASLHLSSLS